MTASTWGGREKNCSNEQEEGRTKSLWNNLKNHRHCSPGKVVRLGKQEQIEASWYPPWHRRQARRRRKRLSMQKGKIRMNNDESRSATADEENKKWSQEKKLREKTKWRKTKRVRKDKPKKRKLPTKVKKACVSKCRWWWWSRWEWANHFISYQERKKDRKKSPANRLIERCAWCLRLFAFKDKRISQAD